MISNPHNVMDGLNFFFVRTVDNILHLNKKHINLHTSQQKIDYCPNTIFVYPVTENAVEGITQSLKRNSSAGLDEIPEYLVKQCTLYIKKPLVHNFNVSFKSIVFPDKVKIAKVGVPLKKEIDKVPKITDQYSFYWFPPPPRILENICRIG
jgi:hypothetical protein